MIQLGQKVRDVVSGFTGIAQARIEWLNGCVRISVQPACGKDKSKDPGDDKTFDQQQLEVINETPIRLPMPARETGGNRSDPKPRRDPR